MRYLGVDALADASSCGYAFASVVSYDSDSPHDSVASDEFRNDYGAKVGETLWLPTVTMTMLLCVWQCWC